MSVRIDKEKKVDNLNYNKKEIIKTWLAGKHSCTLTIPKDFAKEYGLDEPSCCTSIDR